MTQTVIAFFDNSSDAQNAVEELINNGFSRDNIDISLNTVNTEAATTNTEPGNYKDTNESGVGRFFRSLFRDDSYEADKYTRVVERGNSVVTVYAANAEEAQRAADIL